MSLEGMDVEQATRIAQQFDGYERELRNIAAGITSLTNELSYRWRGPASAMFAQQAPGYQAMIAEAANAIADMRARLIANIAQQEQASAAAGGGAAAIAGGTAISGAAALGMLLIGPRTAWDVADRADQFVLKPLEEIHAIATSDGGPEIVSSLRDSSFVQDTNSLMSGAGAARALDVLGKAGLVFGAVGLGVNAWDLGSSLGQHNYARAANDGVSMVATGLMMVPNPITIGAGLAITGIQLGFETGAFQKAFDYMTQSQWTQGLYNPAHFIEHDYFPAVKSVSSDLANTFTRIF